MASQLIASNTVKPILTFYLTIVMQKNCNIGWDSQLGLLVHALVKTLTAFSIKSGFAVVSQIVTPPCLANLKRSPRLQLPVPDTWINCQEPKITVCLVHGGRMYI